MTWSPEPLPAFLTEPTRIGDEISVTGKWTPAAPGRWFFRSEDSGAMRQEWEDIHADARADAGVLSTEINHAIGQDAVLVHHIFESPEALVSYFSSTATRHMPALRAVAEPGLHLVRGVAMDDALRAALADKSVDAAFGEYLFGFVKDHGRTDPDSAIHVTAKWTCAPGQSIEELAHWWQRVGTDAHEIEPGMLRFEVYRVLGEDALIVHEVFEDSTTLRFHLSRGTAARYKKQIDEIAAPEGYFFRGPVSWDIRTYSRFLSLPATYTSLGRQ
ncbi:MAG: antibiotic biosynthesis monooxygenase, partial [Deltaproteobacteria bacterium]|nr:antibiotic biosynthesis monooxygenase [Deltaproteobacteria bacterium]